MKISIEHPVFSNKTTHSVLFYKSDYYLIKSSVEFLLRGVIRGDCIIIAATKKHLTSIELKLRKAAAELGLQIGEHQIHSIDANYILTTFMDDQIINTKKFYDCFEPMLQDILTQYPGMTGYGEMVNVLCEKKNFWAAMKLEKLWCLLVDKYQRMNIHCGYCIKNFNSENDMIELAEICQQHTSFESQPKIVIPEHTNVINKIRMVEKQFEVDMELQSEMLELQFFSEETQILRNEMYKLHEENVRLNEQLELITNQLKISQSETYDILNSIKFPIIFLDKHLHIHRYNTQFEEILALRPHDVGRRISDFHFQFDGVHLTPEIEEVLTKNIPKIMKTRHKNDIVCLLPFTECQSFPNGVVVIFIGSSELL